MANVFSIRVATGTLVSNTPQDVYTVPAAKVLIVRDIWMRANGAVAELFFYNSTSGGRIAGALGSLAASHSEHWTGRQVLNAGETLTGEAVSADANFTISGYLLDAP